MMIRKCLPFPVMVLAVALMGAQSVKDLQFPPLQFHPPEAQERRLSNGIVVFLLEDHELPTLSALALVRTGAIYEPPEKLGLAELAGTVMRSGGTELLEPSALNEELEFIAASVETSVSDEWGQASLNVLKKDLETGLKLFSQVLRQPAFRQDQIDLAKNRIREGIRRRNDFPGPIASREFTKLIYGPNHPLARTVELLHLDNITREDLLAFHRQYFAPQHVILGVAGDFRADEMVAQLEKYLGDWTEPVPQGLPPVAMVEERRLPSIHYIGKEINQTNIRIGHLGIKQTNPDFFAVTVMDNILGGGFSSRLFRHIRSQQGLAYSVSSNYGAGVRELGVFSITLETEASNTGKAIRAVIEEIEKLRNHPVTAEELAVAKESVLNSFVFAFDHPAQIVNRQVRYRYFGLPPDYLQTYRDKVAEVGVEEVQEAARKYVHPDQLTILAVGPPAAREALATLGKVREIELDLGDR